IKKRWNENSTSEKTQASENADGHTDNVPVQAATAVPIIPIAQIPVAPQAPEALPKTVAATHEAVQHVDLPKTVDEIKKMPAITILKPRVPFSGSELKVSPKTQVPIFDFASIKKDVAEVSAPVKNNVQIPKVKKVPRLNVGEESEL